MHVIFWNYGKHGYDVQHIKAGEIQYIIGVDNRKLIIQTTL